MKRSATCLEWIGGGGDEATKLPLEVLRHIWRNMTMVGLFRFASTNSSYNKLVPESVEDLDAIRYMDIDAGQDMYQKLPIPPKFILKRFTNLTSLVVSGACQDSHCDNATISRLTNLTRLKLFGNRVITSDGVRNLTNLSILSMGCTTSIESTCLVNMSKCLTKLNISYCNDRRVTDDSISKLTNLTHLDIRGNNSLTDTIFISLTRLQSLKLSLNTGITDDGIIGLTKLTRLFLLDHSLRITGRGIENMTNLLSLRNTGYASGHSMRNLTNLTHLNIFYRNDITNDHISHLTKLVELDISYSGNIDYRGLENMLNLRVLKSIGNHIPIRSLSRLVNLGL